MPRKKGDKQGTFNRCWRCLGGFYAPLITALCPTCALKLKEDKNYYATNSGTVGDTVG